MRSALLYAIVLGPAVLGGAHRGWPLAAVQLLVVLAAMIAIVTAIADGRFRWRRTALDVPLAALVAVVLGQVALGSRGLSGWALGPAGSSIRAAAALPARFLALGTVARPHTIEALLLLLTYAGVFFVVVHWVRDRRELDRLVFWLVTVGSALGFFGLADYLAGGSLETWRADRLGVRLSSTFVNPDHFGAWLSMVICLGLGYLAARRRPDKPVRVGDVLSSARAREAAIRTYLPAGTVGIMALALVFTLSRGAALGLLAALAAVLGLMGVTGRARWASVVIGSILAATLSYAAWIGFTPFLMRFQAGQYAGRWIQSLSTLPMLRSFPILGVGLGAYRDIYFRYQPSALEPGRVYFPYAHNDLLQFVVEVGLVGTAIGLWLLFTVARDFTAHIAGRGRCPVGGGAGAHAERRDSFSVGIALGGIAALLAMLVDSAFDFSFRIPANGILAAACLGIVTVALHTRFGATGPQPLTEICQRDVGRGLRVLIGAATIAGLVVVVPIIVRPVRVDAALEAALHEADLSAALRVLDAASSSLSGDPRLLDARSRLELEAARELSGTTDTAGMSAGTSAKVRGRRIETLYLSAIRDARAALSSTPSDPWLHERLGWAYGSLAAMDRDHQARDLAEAISHFQRAIALAPENPFLYRSLAAFAAAFRPPLTALSIEAARGAARRDPTLLPDLVDRLVMLHPTIDQWLAVTPDTDVDELELGAVLESRGLVAEAVGVYRRAVELGTGVRQALARWMLAGALIRTGDYRSAVVEMDAALRSDPRNPELHHLRAVALAALGDPSALDEYRAAVASAGLLVQRDPQADDPFRAAGVRAHGLVLQRLDVPEKRPLMVRYQRALARYLSDRKLWDDAVSTWSAVIALDPKDAEASFLRGVALDELGKQNDAIESYRTAVRLDGANNRFRLRLAERLWETEQYYQAIGQWRAALDNDPRDVTAGLALGRAYLKIGDRMQAFMAYRSVLATTPGDPEATRAVARLTGRRLD